MKKDIPLNIEMLSSLDDDKHRISSAREIGFILQHIAREGTRVALYYGGANNFILTTLLEADTEGLWLEQSQNTPGNRRILESKKLIFVSSHLQVKIQFTATQVSSVEHQGYPAFYLPLPDSIYRLQRREHYRVQTPISEPLLCVIGTEKPVFKSLREFTIVDISVGGVGLACSTTDTEMIPGAFFSDCHIELPEVGAITGTVEVKNLVALTSPPGQERKRAGCEFKELDAQSATLLQRYVTNKQRVKSHS
ncbi:MAG TPA: flagellar regulator YcgR PilZN domain-containing protein [Gallionella sp.]|jgi:c-di-GMP-binding flagellar brake protein YcgR|nr:flagellar regulator YcgR PilZN domain-containing protein [Gallionella sp.]